MSGFDDRQRSQENKFALDAEIKFKISSRRRKLLGLWAAESMGLNDDDSLNYAREIISFGIDEKTPGAVIKKITADSQKAGVKLTEAQVKAKNSEFEVIATRQILEDKK